MTTIRELEHILFAAFPARDATSDDRIGLLVGNAEAKVEGIALALDAKVLSIEAAATKGCNVLVTHHPVFWHPPTEFIKHGSSEGAAVYRAAELGVALIAMHTNLDAAPVAREMLLEPAGFVYTAPLTLPSELDSNLEVHTTRLAAAGDAQDSTKSLAALGQLGIPKKGEVVSLCELAARYKAAFGAVAKVWGAPNKPVELLASCSGGGGSLVGRVISAQADCYVVGEVAYHEALELAAFGIALIELGHDRSELPYRFYLHDALLSAGFDEAELHILEPATSWWQ